MCAKKNNNIAIDNLRKDCTSDGIFLELNKLRNLPPNYKELLNSSYHLDFEHFTELNPGVFDFDIGSAHFDCYFHDAPSSRLYVMLRAARGPNSRLVSFERWTYGFFLNSKVLAINNPMYYHTPDLKCGWYLGTKNEDYTQYIVQFVKKISNLYEISPSNIIFFGSSSAGTAAIHCSAYFNGTVSFSLNPQFLPCTTNQGLVDDFEKTGLKFKDIPKKRLDTYDILANSHSRHIICTNIRSGWDFEPLKQLKKYFDIDLTYGISSSKDNKIFVWLYDAFGVTSAHGSFENRTMMYAIDYLVDKVSRKEKIDPRIITIFSEFWFDRFKSLSDNILTLHEILYTDGKNDSYKSLPLYTLIESKWDNPDVWYKLAKKYESGIGVKKDIDIALSYYKQIYDIRQPSPC